VEIAAEAIHPCCKRQGIKDDKVVTHFSSPQPATTFLPLHQQFHKEKEILSKNSQNILHLRPPLLLWSAKSALNVMANIVGNFGRHKKRVTITSLSVLGVISNGSNLML
jgi:hypothetical protein